MIFKRLWIVTAITAMLLSSASCDKNDTLNKEDGKTIITQTPAPQINNTGNAAVSADDEAVTTDKETIPSIANTMTRETYPSVDGSTATIPLSAAVYRFATGASAEEADAEIVHTKTTSSYLSLISGDTDLLIVYEPSAAVYEALGKTNVQLNMKSIGKDALVFLANESNPVKSLTGEQLVQIYSGKITSWSEIGGPDKKIISFQRPKDSGSQTLMQKLVMKEIPMMEAPSSMKPAEMGDIITALADYSNESNALGYSVYYYTQNMYNLPDIRYMAINDVSPDIESIKNNSYPYINEFYAVIREDEPENTNAHTIFNWLTGEDGQKLIEKLGYVPISIN